MSSTVTNGDSSTEDSQVKHWNAFSLLDADSLEQIFKDFDATINGVVTQFELFGESKSDQVRKKFHKIGDKTHTELDFIAQYKDECIQIIKDFIGHFEKEQLLHFTGESNIESYRLKKKKKQEDGTGREGIDHEELPICGMNLNVTFNCIKGRVYGYKMKDYIATEDKEYLSKAFDEPSEGTNFYVFYSQLEGSAEQDANFPFFPHRSTMRDDQKEYITFLRQYSKVNSDDNPRILNDSGIHHLLIHFCLLLAKHMANHMSVASTRLNEVVAYWENGSQGEKPKYVHFEYSNLVAAVQRISIMMDTILEIGSIYDDVHAISSGILIGTQKIRQQMKDFTYTKRSSSRQTNDSEDEEPKKKKKVAAPQKVYTTPAKKLEPKPYDPSHDQVAPKKINGSFADALKKETVPKVEEQSKEEQPKEEAPRKQKAKQIVESDSEDDDKKELAKFASHAKQAIVKPKQEPKQEHKHEPKHEAKQEAKHEQKTREMSFDEEPVKKDIPKVLPSKKQSSRPVPMSPTQSTPVPQVNVPTLSAPTEPVLFSGVSQADLIRLTTMVATQVTTQVMQSMQSMQNMRINTMPQPMGYPMGYPSMGFYPPPMQPMMRPPPQNFPTQDGSN